ncbi:hypothetical protein E4U09_006855 [Claviceps aff. purpurea]|uniref:Uncharacterized protein n=1 Tax=Claviceps aff. purpurea TaxID=1967640 RepID=A0A9P7TZX4_9HYPO|nr:hypothetical protein E4U09_006855 [Claviceps aff. purpurea]
MKAFIFAISLLTFGPGASALPEPELGSITEGDFTFTGGDLPRGDERNLLALSNVQRQCVCFSSCKDPFQECKPYECQCRGDWGCYSCNGGKFLCQKGPNSNTCAQ